MASYLLPQFLLVQLTVFEVPHGLLVYHLHPLTLKLPHLQLCLELRDSLIRGQLVPARPGSGMRGRDEASFRPHTVLPLAVQHAYKQPMVCEAKK